MRSAGRDCHDLLHAAFLSPSSSLGQHYAFVKTGTSLLLDAGPDNGWVWSRMHRSVSNASPRVRRAVADLTMQMENSMHEAKQCEWPPPPDVLEWEEHHFAFAADVLRVSVHLDWPGARPAQLLARDIGSAEADLLALLAARHHSDAVARYLFFLAWSPCINCAQRVPVRCDPPIDHRQNGSSGGGQVLLACAEAARRGQSVDMFSCAARSVAFVLAQQQDEDRPHSERAALCRRAWAAEQWVPDLNLLCPQWWPRGEE